VVDLGGRKIDVMSSCHGLSMLVRGFRGVNGGTIPVPGARCPVPGARCPCGQGIAGSASHEHADFGYRGEMTVGSMLYLCARDYDPSVGSLFVTDGHHLEGGFRG
jgi:hypothetical protein